MFPATTSKHRGQAITSFPDVCKTPGTPSPVPVPYPNVASSPTGTKTATATKPAYSKTTVFKTGSGNEVGVLKGKLSTLHQKLMNMTTRDPTDWHAALDEYVVTTAAVYSSMMGSHNL